MFVVFLALALMSGAGLVIDGGYALGQRRASMNHAEQAARVAADSLSEAALRNDSTLLDADRARAAAESYLHRVGAEGTVDVTGDSVTVRVTGSYRPVLLTLVGVDRIDVSAAASATSIDHAITP